MLGKKISVIGGSGFVGTNLCQILHERCEDFEILDIKPSQRFPDKCKLTNVTNIDSLRKNIEGEVVVLLAAVHTDGVKDPEVYHRVNVHGANNVIKVCTEKNIKNLLFTSSVAVYGFCEEETDETGQIRPLNEYGKSKHKAEECLRSWQEKYKTTLTIVRPTVIFGFGNRGNVYNLLKAIASRKFIMIGSGANRKSIAYVKNVAAFIYWCLHRSEGYALHNYVDKPDLTMNELVSLASKEIEQSYLPNLKLPYSLGLLLAYIIDFVGRVLGLKLPINSLRVKKFCASTRFSARWSSDGLFSPPHDLQLALLETINYEFTQAENEKEIFFTE